MDLLLHQVSKRFAQNQVIGATSISVERVRSLVLIGPSGGGKSTLLRLVAGLLRPESGRIELNGRPIPDEDDARRRYRASLGVVFQAFNLFPHLSARDNVKLPLTVVHGCSEEDAHEIATVLLERFRLGSHGDKRPYELSGGQRQRVAIARALVHRPQLLLLDEPTSALDPEMTGEVLDVIQELNSEGVDFMLVTHEMGFAREVADEIWFLSEGGIKESGSPETLFNRPQSPSTQRFLERVLKY